MSNDRQAAKEVKNIVIMALRLLCFAVTAGRPAYEDLAKLDWNATVAAVNTFAAELQRRNLASDAVKVKELKEAIDKLDRELRKHANLRSAEEADAACAALLAEEEADAARKAQQEAKAAAKAAAKRAKKQRALLPGINEDVFSCPITQVVMRDPVLCSDGHTYERSAITAWLRLRDTSPMTNEPPASKQLVSNVAVRHFVAMYLQHRGAC
ncbi:hypothetical protein WJX72_011173 [[Myrmecia] bisecta]|uniref:U-box domain-containing protein n=1 Tax=[Myrmecia] bisecta TaxID=41462 RepID=A0AAW1RA80_9CHLO